MSKVLLNRLLSTVRAICLLTATGCIARAFGVLKAVQLLVVPRLGYLREVMH
ncbi:MAG: hypothetical protein GX354_00215 [Firmicutes bacterium]|nr:hypothetical protein [Bacillota bacterium]